MAYKSSARIRNLKRMVGFDDECSARMFFALLACGFLEAIVTSTLPTVQNI